MLATSTLPVRCVLWLLDSEAGLIRGQVKGYQADQLDAALEGAKVVVIPAGVPRKVRMASNLTLIRMLTIVSPAWCK